MDGGTSFSTKGSEGDVGGDKFIEEAFDEECLRQGAWPLTVEMIMANVVEGEGGKLTNKDDVDLGWQFRNHVAYSLRTFGEGQDPRNHVGIYIAVEVG